MLVMDPLPRKRGIQWIFSRQKITFLMIIVVMVWGMYLFTAFRTQYDGMKESEHLKKQIITLSKKYIHALAEEKNTKQMIGSSNTQQTAVLLQNMLQRIEQLEEDLHVVIVNSTNSFASIDQVIKKLNKTILQRAANKTNFIIQYECEMPSAHNPAYPHCVEKVEWMKLHWKSNTKFALHGVNGTICSFLNYLSNVEEHCSKTFQMKVVRKPAPVLDDTCVYVADDAFPDCENKIKWMEKFWQSDPIYASHGIDGSLCSFIKFLSEVESWCPLLNGRVPVKYKCAIPKNPAFPNCGDKVAWMRKFWTTDPCYQRFDVNGSICSFISYLSEVESWCPLFPGKSKRKIIRNMRSSLQPDLSQVKLDGLLKKLAVGQEAIKFKWMSERLTRLWPDWVKGFQKLNKRVKLDSYARKKILVYIGLLADETSYHFAAQAFNGGPLGELVQWSDLIAALHLLGHDLTISMNKKPNKPDALASVLKSSMSGLCPSTNQADYDLIYTDYIGLSHMIRQFKNANSIKCILRIVDSFGTEAQFNKKVDNSFKNIYGFYGLNLKQYNTMFPHSPDNTFLGFIVENHIRPGEVLEKGKPKALVYGKHISMWQDHKKIAFLDIVQRYFEVHATVANPTKLKGGAAYVLPRYIINHGILNGGELQKLLKGITLFVGIGFPYEGPAPLEAIANGCFFLNAKLVPPLGRQNDPFFKQKPTLRKLTSQHPYAERFIGKPYVYTVDLKDSRAVEEAMKDIELKSVEPYLPFEFTYEGMLERLYAFLKHHNFCDTQHRQPSGNKTWPPLSAKKMFISQPNEACDEVCTANDLICEPAYFASINRKESFTTCTKTVSIASLIAPGIKQSAATNNIECMLQTNPLLYSCTSKSLTTNRLCPCRDFRRGQTALCKDCLDGAR